MPSETQRTIAKSASLSGLGLFSGTPVNLTFRPAPENHGVVFVRTDLERAAIPALLQYVTKRPRRSALKCNNAIVETTEHVLSAVAGLGIDNLVIELDAAELPGLDGSSKPYVDTLLAAGLQDQHAPKRRLVITEPVIVQ